MDELEKDTNPEPQNTKAKKAKTDAAAAEAQEAVATPAAQDGAPAVTERPSAKADPVVKRARKPAKCKKEEPAPAAAAPPENLSLTTDEIATPKVVKAKGSKDIHNDTAHVRSTYNNTLVTISDLSAIRLRWPSA